jgi:circadian clock protein KaiB
MASTKKKRPDTVADPRKRIRKQRRQAMHAEVARFEQLLSKPTPAGRYVLRLFVTGTTPRSAAAVANIRSLCERHLAGRYDLEVVDIYQQPKQAVGAQIIAAPTLIKQLPTPLKRIVGDLSNPDRVMVCLDLSESTPSPT